jgi:hypothetical protein
MIVSHLKNSNIEVLECVDVRAEASGERRLPYGKRSHPHGMPFIHKYRIIHLHNRYNKYFKTLVTHHIAGMVIEGIGCVGGGLSGTCVHFNMGGYHL